LYELIILFLFKKPDPQHRVLTSCILSLDSISAVWLWIAPPTIKSHWSKIMQQITII